MDIRAAYLPKCFTRSIFETLSGCSYKMCVCVCVCVWEREREGESVCEQRGRIITTPLPWLWKHSHRQHWQTVGLANIKSLKNRHYSDIILNMGMKQSITWDMKYLMNMNLYLWQIISHLIGKMISVESRGASGFREVVLSNIWHLDY